MLRRPLAVAVIALVVLTACSAGEMAAGGASAGTGGGEQVAPIVAEGGPEGLGSCAFEFGPGTLAERQFAFDGTVSEIREPQAQDAPYEVDLEVSRWYQGGDGPNVTVRTYAISGTSLAGDLGLAVGDRILGSGDDGFLWGCGFSMPYSEQGASAFQEAFGG